jgi:hypothetical protein
LGSRSLGEGFAASVNLGACALGAYNRWISVGFRILAVKLFASLAVVASLAVDAKIREGFAELDRGEGISEAELDALRPS